LIIMKRLTLIQALAIALLLFSSAPASAIPFTFTVLPVGGDVSGPAGSTVGWGYEITNPSATDWLEVNSLNADPFVNGTPNAIFDFPILPPGAIVTVVYNSAGPVGLYELTWDPGAPTGFVNSGTFEVGGQFYNNDPLTGGVPTQPGDEQNGAYSAEVTGASVPEPATLLLLGTAALTFARGRRTATRLRRARESPEPTHGSLQTS
jgi:hypothetical protein